MDWKAITLYTRSPFRLSYGVTEHRQVFWVRLTEACGWGEAAIPPYYGVRDDDMLALWRRKAAAALPLPEEVEGIPAWVGADGPAPARCALDMALHDHLAWRRGVPLHALLGLPRPAPVHTALTIPLAEPAEMAAMAVRAAGFPVLKLKLGSDDDVGRVAAVREARPDARLMVDANAGWSAADAVRQIRRLEELGLELVEQPVARDDFEGLAYVQKHVAVPVMADESLRCLEDLERLAGLGVRAVNLKLMKVGGISAGLPILRRARELGVRIMLGCMIETSLGVTAMAHLAGLADWIDLDAPLLIKNDPFVGVRYTEARLELPHGPGIGAVRRFPQEAAERLEALKRERFGDERLTVFDVRLSGLAQGRMVVAGEVLEAHQKEALRVALADFEAPAEEVAVLLGPESPAALVRRVVADLFRRPDGLAERLNQALLGDAVRILEERDGWARVQLVRDGYLGWMQAEALAPRTPQACRDFLAGCRHMIRPALADAYAQPVEGARKVGMLPLGLKVRLEEERGGFAALALPDGRTWWVRRESLLPSEAWPRPDADGVRFCLDLVRGLVGVPYLWGGCTPFGYDCSGLTQVFWSLMGVHLPRDADQQYGKGTAVAVGPDGRGAQPGDLLFFGTPGNPETGAPPRVPHVALSLGGAAILHANGTSWSLTCNSLAEADPDFRPDLRASLLGARRFGAPWAVRGAA